jgi:hypothetical protein
MLTNAKTISHPEHCIELLHGPTVNPCDTFANGCMDMFKIVLVCHNLEQYSLRSTCVGTILFVIEGFIVLLVHF